MVNNGCAGASAGSVVSARTASRYGFRIDSGDDDDDGTGRAMYRIPFESSMH